MAWRKYRQVWVEVYAGWKTRKGLCSVTLSVTESGCPCYSIAYPVHVVLDSRVSCISSRT